MKGAAFLQVPSQNSMLYSWDMEVTPTPEQEAFIRDAIAAKDVCTGRVQSRGGGRPTRS